MWFLLLIFFWQIELLFCQFNFYQHILLTNFWFKSILKEEERFSYICVCVCVQNPNGVLLFQLNIFKFELMTLLNVCRIECNTVNENIYLINITSFAVHSSLERKHCLPVREREKSCLETLTNGNLMQISTILSCSSLILFVTFAHVSP